MKQIRIVDFDKKYAKVIDDMELQQWGDWEESILDKQANQSIIRVALVDEIFAGVAYGMQIDDFFWIDVICILPKYQKQGVGSLLLQDLIMQAKLRLHINKIKVESVVCNGKSNSQRLIEKNKFLLVGIEKGFWGKQYPEVYCTECNSKPCVCTALLYELNL